jgi:hypothetical protein
VKAAEYHTQHLLGMRRAPGHGDPFLSAATGFSKFVQELSMLERSAPGDLPVLISWHPTNSSWLCSDQ